MPLPGWNNFDSVQAIHAWLEGGALLFFAGLVPFDVLAHLAERESSKEKKLERIGLACFGVAVFAEILGYPYGRRNDDLSSGRIAELNVEAEKAMERASRADERAVNAEREIARLENEAAQARKETAELNARIADRELNADQQRKIAARLHEFGGHVVYMRSYPNEREGARLVLQIKSALSLAHVMVEDRTGELLSGPLVTGIHINNAPGEREFAETLYSALTRDGNLSVEELSQFGSSAPVTEILVGVKPAALAAALQREPLKRHLDPQQRERVASKLRDFTGQKFNLFGYSADSEIIEFANEFLSACCNRIQGAGWVESVSSIPIGEITGILVLLKPEADPMSRRAASALVSALEREGLNVTGPQSASDHRTAIGINPSQPFQGMLDGTNPITIVIGKRPEPRP